MSRAVSSSDYEDSEPSDIDESSLSEKSMSSSELLSRRAICFVYMLGQLFSLVLVDAPQQSINPNSRVK